MRGFEPLTPCLQGRCSPNWLPILRVHKLPLLSLKFMLCKIIVYAVFKVRRDSMSLPSVLRRPNTSFLFWRPPALPCRLQHSTIGRTGLNRRVRDGNGCVPCTYRRQISESSYFFFLRKEVIQPHLPIRLPCYDFTPVIGPTLGSSLLAVGSLTSGVADSHGVTGGVYKTRERIHRSMLICDY